MAKLPLQANFYPMTSMAYIQDPSTRLTVITAQSLGAASLKPGVCISGFMGGVCVCVCVDCIYLGLWAVCVCVCVDSICLGLCVDPSFPQLLWTRSHISFVQP